MVSNSKTQIWLHIWLKPFRISLKASSPSSIYDFKATDIDGNEVALSKYQGHACIIVNVASKWGKTAVNYQQLVALQQKVSSHSNNSIFPFCFSLENFP